MARKTAAEKELRDTTKLHSFHIQLSESELRRLRIAAAEQDTSAGRLAREMIVKALDEQAKRYVR